MAFVDFNPEIQDSFTETPVREAESHLFGLFRVPPGRHPDCHARDSASFAHGPVGTTRSRWHGTHVGLARPMLTSHSCGVAAFSSGQDGQTVEKHHLQGHLNFPSLLLNHRTDWFSKTPTLRVNEMITNP